MSQKDVEIKYLCRYTRFTYLLNILRKREIIMGNYSKWEDKNDTHFLELYKKWIGAENIFALCFVQYKSPNKGAEKYHHWKTFASGTDGVCILFEKKELKEQFKSQLGESLRCGQMKYRIVSTIEKNARLHKLRGQDLPFIKRAAFSDEREYRFVCSGSGVNPIVVIPNLLDSIARINFNPWIPMQLYKTKCEEIRKIEGCRNIDIKRSTCIEYERWKECGELIASSMDIS